MVTDEARTQIWDPIRNENCTLCPLHRSAQSVCLMGDGPVPSRVVLVGEAPGYREDEISKPFAGKAGQLLDSVLSEVGLPRESVYITNAAKCRPPDNRTPTKTELKTCNTYLQRELKVLNPEFVVPLGNAALEATLGEKGIMKKRGALIEKDGIKYLPTLHPAAVLRNESWGSMLKADLLKLARAVAGEETRPQTKSYIIRSSKSLRQFLRLLEEVPQKQRIAFDLETWGPGEEGGLREWQPGGIILTASFTWEAGTSYVLALEHPSVQWDIPINSVYQALNIALEGRPMFGHNGKFDGKWLRKKGVNVSLAFDTHLAAHLLDENRPLGLKSLARTLLGADDYEANISFREPHRLDELAIYNGKDTDYTFRLYKLFRKQLKERPRLLNLFKNLTMPAANAFMEIETHGFPVDMDRLRERNDEILEKIESIRQQILEYVPEDERPFANFRSPIFLARFFYQYLELPVLVYTKTGKASTAESVLLKLKKKHPAVGLLMELRKWMKYESTYTRNWLARTSSAGKSRLFTSYNIAGTVTGRLSSNMQQVPRDLLIRGIIGTDPTADRRRRKKGKPSRKFVEADFSQVELRIAAMFSRDPALTRTFNEGGDPHTETAAAVTGKEPKAITKEERKMAKAVNFGFLYGMGSKKFRVYADEKYGVKISDEEAAEYRRAFFRQYRGLLPWHDRQRRLVRSMGQVSSPLGRIRHLPAINSGDDFLEGQAEREAINAPVQGFASDLTVLSMVRLHAKLDRSRGRVIGNVHDAILFEIDEDYVDEARVIIKKTMENLPLKKLFGFTPSIPIAVDIGVSDHWGEGEH